MKFKITVEDAIGKFHWINGLSLETFHGEKNKVSFHAYPDGEHHLTVHKFTNAKSFKIEMIKEEAEDAKTESAD